MITGGQRFSRPMQCFRYLYAVGGVRALFRGMGIVVVREVPAFASYMTTYTFIRRHFTLADRHEPSLGLDLLAGGTAGVVSWVITIPADVVKSRLQSDR
jgi:solute carrier family 25 carnitine/acylcarnitine transporter 20/29